MGVLSVKRFYSDFGFLLCLFTTGRTVSVPFALESAGWIDTITVPEILIDLNQRTGVLSAQICRV